MMMISQHLFDLAPTHLRIHRKDRYSGGGFNASIRDFAPQDAALIARMYDAVKKVYDLWLYMKDSPNYELAQQVIVQEVADDEFLDSALAIGSATYALDTPSDLTRKVIHDIRGGALTALVGNARFLAQDPAEEEWVKGTILMARDHAKVMRNALVDLDPTVRLADESIKIHPISDFVNKWENSSIRLGTRNIAVEVISTFSGNITNRCLETSAIDRILYNYINNAARFAADNKVKLSIFPVGDGLVRWVVQNALLSDQADWLAKSIGPDLRKLFASGVTRGSTGIGLSSCADFVSASFGLEPQDAIMQGYLGAKVIDQHFYAWFHWPSYVASPDEAICQCGD